MRKQKNTHKLFPGGIGTGVGTILIVLAIIGFAAPAQAGLATQDLNTLTPTDMANSLLGSGVTINSVGYTGANIAAGQFNGGTGIIGIEQGVILSSGDIKNVIGPNKQDGITANNGLLGDADLNSLIPGYTTYDASALNIDFTPTGDTLIFKYVFMSDEYNEYANTNFNDVFGFFLNGKNVALLPGTNIAVSINNVNGGNPFGTNAKNPAYYINNDLNDGGGSINTEMDGLTKVLTVTADVKPNEVNHIKLAIADAGDRILDSNVFIEGGSFESFVAGNISGQKFNDANHNGAKDAGEAGIPDWQINLTKPDGTVIATTTDANGNYIFDNLKAGEYKVEEKQVADWTQTFPAAPGTYTLTVTEGKSIKDIDFGNAQIPKTGNISGIKIVDTNGNGAIDAGEPGLAGIEITAKDSTGVTVATTTTDASGNYKLTLPVGTYTIGETLVSSWSQTIPGASSTGSETYTVDLKAGDEITGKDFGNVQYSKISGSKIEDLNANGIQDAGEVKLAGWKIDLLKPDGSTLSATTDANGDYGFENLLPGAYTLTENMQANWAAVAPANGYTVTITSGMTVENQNFYNFHQGKITAGGGPTVAIQGDSKATFGLVGQYPDGSSTAQGNVEFQDHGAKLNIKSTEILTVATTADGKKGTITGTATVNGAGSYPFEVYVEDNGEPGKGVDVFKITLPTYPYSNGGILNGGNIQIH